ncbi:MAG: hypothetical protein ABR606_01610 [Vicinamibacterales bacterium]
MTPNNRVFLPALTLTLALVVLALSASARAPRFYDDDPLWTEPLTQNVEKPSRYEPSLMYQSIINLFAKPGDPVLGQRAKDLNTVDEVPDSPFYVNRAGRMPLTPEMVARASNTAGGPADGPWSVVSAKSDGITPGFTIRDRNKDLWFLKFDPPGWTGMATGAEVIAAKLFWAVGYHTVEYYIEDLQPTNLTIADDATIEPPGQPERRLRRDDIDWLLGRADRSADGSYRIIASKAAPGRPVGRIRFEGTRPDDPNDLVAAEHRRALRGYRVFAAWINHVDAKGINSIAALVNERGRQFIRRYLLDFGSTLGSAAIGPREEWEGFEQLVEPRAEIGKRVGSLGLRIPEWRRAEFYEGPALGRLPKTHGNWNPDTWQPHITNAAFRHARADDKFWAAHKLTFVTDDMIAAAIREGKLGDPEAERILAEVLAARRARILETYLPAVNPIVNPAIDGGTLRFVNAAVEAKVAAAPAGYTAEWMMFDNATGTSTPLVTTTGEGPSLPTPSLPIARDAFIRVNISASSAEHQTWATPVSAYFRRSGEGWKLVGFERLADK